MEMLPEISVNGLWKAADAQVWLQLNISSEDQMQSTKSVWQRLAES